MLLSRKLQSKQLLGEPVPVLSRTRRCTRRDLKGVLPVSRRRVGIVQTELFVRGRRSLEQALDGPQIASPAIDQHFPRVAQRVLAPNALREHRSGGQVVRLRMAELLFVDVMRRCLETLPGEQTSRLAGLRYPLMARALAMCTMLLRRATRQVSRNATGGVRLLAQHQANCVAAPHAGRRDRRRGEPQAAGPRFSARNEGRQGVDPDRFMTPPALKTIVKQALTPHALGAYPLTFSVEPLVSIPCIARLKSRCGSNLRCACSIGMRSTSGCGGVRDHLHIRCGRSQHERLGRRRG